MAFGVNCQFECVLGKDPEMKFTASGKAVTKVSAAVKLAVKKDGDDSVADTLWINLVFWNRAAEVVNSQLVKGDRLVVTNAQFSQRSYEANDGTTKWVTEFTVWEFSKAEKLDWSGGDGQSKSSNNQRQASSNKGSAKPATSASRAKKAYDEDDDIPF